MPKKLSTNRPQLSTSLPSREVGRKRMVIAAWLKTNGCNFGGIAQVMRCTKNEARTLVARATRRGVLNEF